MAVAVVFLLLVAAGVAWWGLAGAPEAEAAQVQLETVSASGPSPFTAPVGEDTANVSAPANATGEQPGDTGGLYAQDPGTPSCDIQALLTQLTSDPSKGAAWAQPMGTTADGIGSFVAGLNAVSLRADTAVTEYGFSAGQYQPYPAVLQAGTAVLVNSYGEPTVKCYSGNPLGRPTPSNDTGTVVGTPWNGFAAERTIRVTPTAAPLTRLVVVDPSTDTQTPVPGKGDPKTTPGPNPRPPTNGQGQLLLTGTHNYDGTITLSDGRIITADGTVKKPAVEVTHPPGSKTLADGGIQRPDGRVFNRDGTERRGIVFAGPPQRTVNPDGSTTPALTFGFIKWNYDGSFSIIDAGKGGSVKVVDQNGVLRPAVPPVPAGSVVNGDGSVTTPDGKILNPNGAQRPPKQSLPGGVVLEPDGGNVPPARAEVPKTFQGTDGQIGAAGKPALQGPLPGAPGGNVEQIAPGGPQNAQPECGPGTAAALCQQSGAGGAGDVPDPGAGGTGADSGGGDSSSGDGGDGGGGGGDGGGGDGGGGDGGGGSSGGSSSGDASGQSDGN